MAIIYRIITVLVLAAALLGGWFYYTDEGEKIVTFRTVELEHADYLDQVQATGTLEPQEIVDVGSQVTGEIMEFGVDADGKRVDYGSEVKAGQLLARIDDTVVELTIKRYEASVAQAQASILTATASIAQSTAAITQAKANHEKAKRDLERAKQLGVGEALSQMSYDEYVTSEETAAASLESSMAQLESSKASKAQAEASLLSAQAQLDSELRNRDYTRITTPVDGTIIVRQVNVGETVVSSMSSTTLFLVARDLRKMQIWSSVNEVDVPKIKAGQKVTYTVDGLPDMIFEGVVNKVRPNATMSSNVVTYVVEIDTENPDRVLLPYMSALVSFIVQEEKSVDLIPNEALDFTPDAEFIFGNTAGPSAKEGGPREGGPMAGGPREGGPREGGPMAGGPRGEKGADSSKKDAPKMIWKRVEGDKVKPVPVEVLANNGTQSWIKTLDGSSLNAGEEYVVGISVTIKSDDDSTSGKKGMLEMKRPAKREQGTGGPRN